MDVTSGPPGRAVRAPSSALKAWLTRRGSDQRALWVHLRRRWYAYLPGALAQAAYSLPYLDSTLGLLVRDDLYESLSRLLRERGRLVIEADDFGLYELTATSPEAASS